MLNWVGVEWEYKCLKILDVKRWLAHMSWKSWLVDRTYAFVISFKHLSFTLFFFLWNFLLRMALYYLGAHLHGKKIYSCYVWWSVSVFQIILFSMTTISYTFLVYLKWAVCSWVFFHLLLLWIPLKGKSYRFFSSPFFPFAPAVRSNKFDKCSVNLTDGCLKWVKVGFQLT